MSSIRCGIVIALAVLLVFVPGPANADDEVRLTEEGYCVLVSPSDPPYVFVDTARCGPDDGG